MKIYFILWRTGLAGGIRAIFEAANRLRGRGYDIRIAALGGDHTWFNVKVPVEYVPFPKQLRRLLLLYRVLNLKLLLLISNKLRRRAYDAFIIERAARRLGFHADLIKLLSEHIPEADVHIATYYPTALSLYLSGVEGCKLYFLQDFPELVEEVDGKYGLKLFELSLRLPFNVFLCNSSYTRELVERYNSIAKTIVTGVGVDMEVFRPRRGEAIDVGKEKRKVMVIIRGLKFKGDEVAVSALNIVSQRIPIHAILVGRRPNIEKLFRRVEPKVTSSIFEKVDDDTLAKLYSSADIFLFTSYAESFGLPPLEAMACGTPVVTTDCKGNRDYARDGYNCLIVHPGDPKAVADAVIKVLLDDKLREKLIKGGLKTARQWTWDRVVDRFEEALRCSRGQDF